MVADDMAPEPGADGQALADLERRGLEPGDETTLAGLLAHPAKQVRLRAAALLSEAISQGRAPSGLGDRLLASGQPEVRWGAAFAISRAGVVTARTLDVALEALGVDDGDVRWAAASIIAREARDSDTLRVRLRSLSTNGSPRSRKMALLCLCESGVTDGALYRGALTDDDPFVRLAAVTSLGRSGDRSAESLDALRAASEGDADVRVRRGAGAILSRLTA